MNKNKKYLLLFTFISLGIHTFFLATPFSQFLLQEFSPKDKSTALKIRSIRIVGEDKGVKEKLVYLKNKAPIEKTITRPKKKNKPKFSAKSLAADYNPFLQESKSKNKITADGIKPQKALRSLNLNNNNIKGFLKDTPNYKSAREYLNSFENTDSMVKLEVPKGVKESELNKHELVFYSFQKRTAQVYINSFYKKLNEFKVKNPHLKFPISTKKERMTGRVVYDKDGNIVRINMLKWSQTKKLQDFFMDVLQEMTALPNPPKAFLKDDQFTVFFSLIVNS